MTNEKLKQIADEFITTSCLPPNYTQEIAAELLALREQTRWIPVSERLPQDGQDVLCLDTDKGIYMAMYRPNSNSYRWDCDTYGMTKDDVTHWRPLPTPPEEAPHE